MLGSRVWPDKRTTEQASHRRGVHDVALLCGVEHSRDECTHAVDHTPHADVDRPRPVVLGEFPLATKPPDTCVVAEHVHLSVCVDDVLRQRLDICCTANVSDLAVALDA